MEPPGPSENVHAGDGRGSSTKSYRMELVDKMPDNPKRLVFESTQQRYEIPLRQDERLPPSTGTTSASAPQNRDADASRSPFKHPAEAATSRDHSQRRTHAAQRVVDKVPSNLRRVVFESSQERFEHRIRQDHVLPSVDDDDSDDDFMPFPNSRSSPNIVNSKNVGPSNSRQKRARMSTGECLEARQRKKRATNRSPTVNVRCNPADVIFTAQLLNKDQHAAIEADGFGQFLRMKIDAIENKNLLSWLFNHTDPISMLITIAPGKVLPITPRIISIVLGLPIGGQNLKIYSRKEGVSLRQRFISDLNQNLKEDCDIHISSLQQEILRGNVNPLFKRCFFMILCNRLLLPSSSNNIGSLDIKRSADHELFSVVDWSQVVFNDLQLAVRAWHDRDKTQLTQNIYGCAIFLIIYYIDNIDHPLSPADRTSTPRITFYDNDLIHRLTDADTTITIHGAITFGLQPLKIWNTTCYSTADARGVPSQHTNHATPGMPHFDIPRLQDLLSQPIAGLTGLRRERVQGFFAEFDCTLSQNTRSIEHSIGNIVRAQIKLAEQCRPILHSLVSSQSEENNNPVGTSSRMPAPSAHDTRDFVRCTPPLSPGHEDHPHCSFVSAPSMLSSHMPDHATSTCYSPGPSSLSPMTSTVPFGSPVRGLLSSNISPEHLPIDGVVSGIPSRDTYDPNLFGSSSAGHTVISQVPVQTPFLYSFSNATTQNVSPSTSTSHVIPSCSVSASMAPIHRQSSAVNISTAVTCDAHEVISTSAKQIPPGRDTSSKGSSSIFNWPILDDLPLLKLPGKRLIKKPSKFCSPFKPGMITRPPPNLEVSLSMLAFLCEDDSSLKRKTVMNFGSEPVKGKDISLSFGIGMILDSMFMDGFVKCIAEDDLTVRPDCHGYRIFLQPLISDILKSESFTFDTSRPNRTLDTLLDSIKRCLPDTDLKKAKMIFLPVLHLAHWSVYCINISQGRVDVLDSMDYGSSNEATWDAYHSPIGQILMQRLTVALSLASPRTFPPFGNWRRVPIQVPFHKGVNDSGIFSMKFIEFYDGEGHGSLHTTIDPDRSRELRAEMLYYLAFHNANRVHPPDELLQFRLPEVHPSFHPMFY